MDVGIYFDLRNPPGWRTDWARTYSFALEMCEEAEHLGASSVWLSEHHLFEDGYLPQPLTFAAAVAARTRRVRIGTAVLLAPLRQAAHLAEEAAVVDLVSGGRLDLGLGAGYRIPEFELFGQNIDDRYRATSAMVRDLREIWARGAVTPPPVQDPVPIWLGFNGPQGARRAGRMGEGLLSASPTLLEPYLAGLREGGHDVSTARMKGSIPAFVTDDPEGDWPLVSRHFAYQWDSYRSYMIEGTGRETVRPVDPDRSRAGGLRGPAPALLYGTPAEVAPAILEYAAGSPVQTVFLWLSLAGLPEEVVAQHLRTICTGLAPLLAGSAG